jgi:hypothetical protein
MRLPQHAPFACQMEAARADSRPREPFSAPFRGCFRLLGPWFPAIRCYVTSITRPLTNAERQRRWRDRRNALIEALTGSPAKAAAIIGEIGIDRALALGRALQRKERK